MKIIINTKERRDLARTMVGNIRGDENMEVLIQPYIEKKSDEQRNLFHALCRQLKADTGYTEGEVKELIKRKILGTRLIKIGNTEAEVVSSSEFDDEGNARSKGSYSELIEGIYLVAGEAGISLGAA